MNPYIFGINKSEECFKYIYITTPTSVFVSGPKEDKNGTLAKQTLGVTDLIYGLYTQL